jgi:hypothetical protein
VPDEPVQAPGAEAVEAAEVAEVQGERPAEEPEEVEPDGAAPTAPEPEPAAEAGARVREPVEALVQDRPAVEPPSEPEPSTSELVEQRAAQRLKRVLADEQNEVLDRLRQRDRRRTLTVDLLLGGDLDRIARYRDALLVVLVEPVDGEGEATDAAAVQAEAVAADAAEAIVRGTRSRVEVLLEESVDGREVDEDRVVDGVRACFREWKTQWLVRLAADSVALTSAGRAEPA